MKRLSFLAILALAACANPGDAEEGSTSNGRSYPQQEIFETEVNGAVVYGVSVRDSAGYSTGRGYEITLKLGERAWKDTLIMELTRKEMIQGEIIFGDAQVDDMGGATVEMRRFDLQ